MAEQKMVGALGHWVAGGTPSASAKRSVEQKMKNKNWRNKNLVGTLSHWVVGTPSASAQRSVEQKCGTKFGGTKIWWGPSRTLSASTKRSVEQKCGTKNGRTKIWWGPSRSLSASAKRSAEQKMAELKCRTKKRNKKLVGTLGHWVAGVIPSANAKS